MPGTKSRNHGHTLPVLHPFSFRRWRRDKAKLSQQEAADKLGLGIATVRSWESMKRPITAPGMVAWAVQAINYDLKPADIDTFRASELRQYRLDRINEKAAKSGDAGPGRVVSFSDRSKTNALPGVDPETGEVIVADVDVEVIHPVSFKAWRDANKLTLKDIAERFVVSPTTPKKWSIGERAMPSPMLVRLACAAIDAGLKRPAFDEADLTTIEEVRNLHAEYLKDYAVAEKRGRIALIAFIDKHENDDREMIDGPDGHPWLTEDTDEDLTPEQEAQHQYEMDMEAMRDAFFAEMDGEEAIPVPQDDSVKSALDLTFLSRKIAEAVDGLPVKDAEVAIKQILSGIPPVELRRSIRAKDRKSSGGE